MILTARHVESLSFRIYPSNALEFWAGLIQPRQRPL